MPSRTVCFVCGSLGGEYQLHSRPREGGAYFPFLEHHDPPKGSRIPGPNGIVDSCGVCYAFLTQQWDTYECTNTPAIKRLYWLKRLDDGQFTGAEMKLQGEYMAQVMGLQYQPLCGDNCAPLSPDSRDGFSVGNRDPDFHTSRKQPQQEEGEGVLDLSVPIKSETWTKSTARQNQDADRDSVDASNSRPSFDEFGYVCFTCGGESQGVAAKYISSTPHAAHEPFFPFLSKLTPPKNATPLNNQGVCKVCEHCFSSLCHQWLSYEHHGTPNSARIFKVNDLFFSNDSNIAMGGGSDVQGGVKEVCYLCSHSWIPSKMCSLFTMPVSRKEEQMYFPFIRELRRPHGARPLHPDGSVRVCESCFGNLQVQWHRFQMENVPFLQRRYTLLPSSSSSSSVSGSSKLTLSVDLNVKHEFPKSDNVSRPVTQPLMIEISKSPPQAKNPPKALPVTVPYQPVTPQPVAMHNSTETRHSSCDTKMSSSSAGLSIPHPLQQAGERPKKVCFLCGEKCLAVKTQKLYSYPARHETKTLGGQSQTMPFFPFLANHEPASGSEPMTEEGTVISCSYCWHSLFNQWRDFEESKGITDRNRWLRKYTLNEFVCFVCGMMVPRKKMRTLEVQKFMFLREHKAPPNALVMWDGEAVGACASCHYSLTHQYTEFERLGLPIELRKYNWTVQHHVEENSCDTQDSSQEPLCSVANEDSNFSVTEGTEESPHGYPPGIKPPLSMIIPPTVTAASTGKHPPKTATVPPLNQMSPSNGLTTTSSSSNLGASRTSSFAAALRKLAHQAKDPSDDVFIKHGVSPPSSERPKSVTPKRSQNSLVFPSHTSTSSLISPPVVTIAPTLAHHHHSLVNSDSRQSLDRVPSSHSSSSFENVSKQDRDQGPLSSNSKDDDRASGKDSLLRSSHLLPQVSSASNGMSLTSQALDMYARGFPSFYPEEEVARHGLPVPYGIDPAAYVAAAAAAAYHPVLLQQQAAFAQSPFRLDDPMLLEHYRMLQSPYLPFSTGGLMPPPAPGLGVHPALAAAAAGQRYPPEFLQQHFPYLSPTHSLLDPQLAAQIAMYERLRYEEEKARELREKEKEHDRERSRDREREMGSEAALRLEREREHYKEQHLSPERLAREKTERRDILTVPTRPSFHSTDRGGAPAFNDSSHSRSSSSLSRSDGLFPGSHSSLNSYVHPKEGGLDKMTSHLDFQHSLRKSSDPYSSHENYSSRAHKNSDHRGNLTEHYPFNKISTSSSAHPVHHYSQHHLDLKHHSPLPTGLSSTPTPDLHNHQRSLHLPHLQSPSHRHQSNHLSDKVRHTSDSTTLFRPFDDNKKSPTSSESRLSSSLIVSHSQQHDPQVHRNLPTMPQKSPKSRGGVGGGVEKHSEVLSIPSVKVHPMGHAPSTVTTVPSNSSESLSLSSSTLMPLYSHFKPISTCINDRVERFDFKSLASECTSSKNDKSEKENDPEISYISEPRSPRGVAGSKRCLSKLDREEANIREKRRKGDSSSTEDDIDEDERTMARLSLIGRVTPIPLQTSPGKIELLDYLGITTWERKRELRRKKEARRRRQLGLACHSPVLQELDNTKEFNSENTSALSQLQERVLPDGGSIHPDVLKCDVDSTEKSKFLASLGLMPLTHSQRIEVQKKRRFLCEVDRMRKNSTNLVKKIESSKSRVGYSGTKNIDKEPNSGSSSKTEQSCDRISRKHHFLQPHHEHKSRSHSSNSPRSNCDAQNASVIFPHGGGRDLATREFVEQFHKSVLQQSSTEFGRSHTGFSSHPAAGTHRSHPWLGVEAATESYQRHREDDTEQSVEAQMLHNRCQRLQAEKEDLEQTAKRYGRQMAALIEEKQRMEEERNQYQNTIRHLKQSFYTFR